MDQPKALLVALGPFEIIHQGPVKIAADIDAIIHCPLQFAQVAAGEVDPLGVIGMAIQIDPVVAGDAVFGDDNGQLVALMQVARPPVEGFLLSLPEEEGLGVTPLIGALDRLGLRVGLHR